MLQENFSNVWELVGKYLRTAPEKTSHPYVNVYSEEIEVSFVIPKFERGLLDWIGNVPFCVYISSDSSLMLTLRFPLNYD